MPKFPIVSTKKAIHALELSGCWVERQGKGDHIIIKRRVGNTELSSSIPRRKDVPVGTMTSVLDDLEIPDSEFRANVQRV